MRSFAAAALLFLASCADSGTGGERVEVDFAMRGVSIDDGPIATTTSLVDPSWTIELDEAALLVGGVYAYPPLPVVTRLERTLDVLLGPSVARAHGGDDNQAGRRALFESLDAFVVDGLDPSEFRVGAFVAEAGVVATASVVLMPAYGENAGTSAPTRGGVAFVRGTAEQGERVVAFEATLSAGSTVLRRRVDAISAVGTLRPSSHIVLSVAPLEWLREVDFAEFERAVEPSADGVRRPAEGSQFMTAWYLAVHSARAYSLRVVDERSVP
jgi:hypothetical protein